MFYFARTSSTKSEQYAVFERFMKENPAMADGTFKKETNSKKYREFWQELKDALNSEGPPFRDVVGWRKVCFKKMSVIIPLFNC